MTRPPPSWKKSAGFLTFPVSLRCQLQTGALNIVKLVVNPSLKKKTDRNACQPECFHFVWGCEPCLPVDGVQDVLAYSRKAWRPEYLELNESEESTDQQQGLLAHSESLPLVLTSSQETAM